LLHYLSMILLSFTFPAPTLSTFTVLSNPGVVGCSKVYRTSPVYHSLKILTACNANNKGHYLYNYATIATTIGYIGELYPSYAGTKYAESVSTLTNELYAAMDHWDTVYQIFIALAAASGALTKTMVTAFHTTDHMHIIDYTTLVTGTNYDTVTPYRLEIHDMALPAGSSPVFTKTVATDYCNRAVEFKTTMFVVLGCGDCTTKIHSRANSALGPLWSNSFAAG
jgi:hypothetical protein